MDAKLSPYHYKKGNILEIVYINPADGFKITIGTDKDQSAILVPIDETEEFIKYIVRAAKISGNTLTFDKESKMRALDITESKVKKFDELENKAITVIEKALGGEGDIDGVTKIAIQTLNIVSKNRQTLTNRQAIGWSIAHTIASPEELKRYIAVTNPELTKILVGDKKVIESKPT